MQRGPQPALSQAFLEQQPSGAGVSPGQERGNYSGLGSVSAGEETRVCLSEDQANVS